MGGGGLLCVHRGRYRTRLPHSTLHGVPPTVDSSVFGGLDLRACCYTTPRRLCSRRLTGTDWRRSRAWVRSGSVQDLSAAFDEHIWPACAGQ